MKSAVFLFWLDDDTLLWGNMSVHIVVRVRTGTRYTECFPPSSHGSAHDIPDYGNFKLSKLPCCVSGTILKGEGGLQSELTILIQ